MADAVDFAGVPTVRAKRGKKKHQQNEAEENSGAPPEALLIFAAFSAPFSLLSILAAIEE